MICPFLISLYMILMSAASIPLEADYDVLKQLVQEQSEYSILFDKTPFLSFLSVYL